MMKEIKKIAIFRALQLGDLLCAIPSIRALKNSHGEADIYLIGMPWAESFVKRFSHYFSGFIPFSGYPGLPELPYDVKKVVSFIREMQQQKFDLVLQMQGNGTLVNQLIELMGARQCGGYYTPSDYKPPGNLFMPYPNYGHEIERHLLLMQFLGINDMTPEMEFPIQEEDQIAFAQLDRGIKNEQYFCIHPGSRGKWRQWPPSNFARIADLVMENNYQAVITGTLEEMDIVNEVICQMKHTPVIAAGKTTLGSLAVLVKNAFGIVSNCTGISHMAAALKSKGVIISMDGEPHRWAPLDKEHFFTINWLEDPDFSKVVAGVNTLIHEGSFSLRYQQQHS